MGKFQGTLFSDGSYIAEPVSSQSRLFDENCPRAGYLLYRLFHRPEKFRQMMFPPLGSASGTVTAGFFAGGNQNIAALPNALDLSLHNAQFGWISFVIGR